MKNRFQNLPFKIQLAALHLGMTLQRVARMKNDLGGGSLTLLGVMYHTKGAYKGRKGSNKEAGTLGGGAVEFGKGGGVVAGLPAGFDDMVGAVLVEFSSPIA
jgi:hypothetical protein